MSEAKITNDYIYVSLSELSDQEIAHVKAESTYKDSSIAYQIKNLSSRRWASQSQIDALKAKLKVMLWQEDDGILILPQGFLHLLPERVQKMLDDHRTWPKTKTLIWSASPKHALRYYQREAIDALKPHTRGQAVMATGTGKSLTMLTLVREMGLKTLIICPSSIIGNQLFKLFSDHLGKRVVGMYGSGKKEVKQVTVSLYQSVTRNIELFKDFEMVIVDESQTMGAGSLVQIVRGLKHVPYFYSVSATNYRADGRTPEIYAASGDVRYSFDTVRAIKEKFLAQPRFLMRKVSSPTTRQHELKQKNYEAHVVKNEQLSGRIILDASTMLAAGKATLILVQEIEHGEHLSGALGCDFANGENKKSLDLIDDLNKGKIKCLVAGAQICGVGVDTVRVDCLIMASFPGTKGLTTQLVGRGLRLYPGKDSVIVLDYHPVDNNMLSRHAISRLEWYAELGPTKEI